MDLCNEKDIRALQSETEAMYVAADPVADSLVAQMRESAFPEQIVYGKSWHKITSCCVKILITV